METSKTIISKLGIMVGLVTSAMLIGYFFLMKALGLSEIVELRFFNFVILGAGICYGIKKLKSDIHEEEFYFKGIAEGALITIVSVVVFAIFMTSYLFYFDVELLRQIKSQIAKSEYITSGSIFILILMEGMASGAVISFGAMQYFKSTFRKKIITVK